MLVQYVPVDTCLPCRVGEAIEHVQNKGACKARVAPVLLLVEEFFGDACIATGARLDGRSPFTGVGGLELVAASPNNHDQGKQGSPSNPGTRGAAHASEIKSEAKYVGADNLHGVVDYAVESTSSCVEVSTVDLGEVVSVEPVGRQEHWEQGQNVWVGEEAFPKTHDFG